MADSVVVDCVSVGVPRIWLHRGLGPGSVSEKAIAYCREHGVSVIPSACPNMFGATSDPGHRCLRAMLRLTGKIPGRLAAEDYPCIGLEPAPMPQASPQDAGTGQIEG